MFVNHFTAQDVAEIKASDLFSKDWYLDTYPDVAWSGIDPAEHYLWLGASMGRDPSARFSNRDYLRDFPDVAERNINPLLHYLRTGRHEGRSVKAARQVRRWSPPFARFVPRTSFTPLQNKKARVIAFYLPQFHPFPENDAWWGKDFTEWTNVKPARPQFVGHHQPHIPHSDVGYYDLLEPGVMAKQAELAAAYGIDGFCFYYYRFNGHRLMERALDQWLGDPSIKQSFCLCWANENWSRRWDGSDADILIAQQHTPEDDLDCIADLARYICDERCIRINGKPLVIIYRPSLLPDAKATAARWRRWCRENGIGEIYLAYTQSFESVDPRTYGFDAAIEFPPNNSGAPQVTETTVPFADDFAGTVYDWRVFVERSETYTKPPYKLFRGVCPGWDNTARRRNKGAIFVNNTPELYERWLRNAIQDTRTRFTDPEERLVFVNAWNEWAEGAHLEPDTQTGFAYLEATRRALDPTAAQAKLALVVHAFYPDVFCEVLRTCSQIGENFTYYVSTVPAEEDTVRGLLEAQSRPYKLTVANNHGRDVLPFLRTLQDLVNDGVDFFAKVHTKRSLHRQDGHEWRRQLYDAVIGVEAFSASIRAMQDDPSIGLVGPDGHLVCMETYLGNNEGRIQQLAARLGIHPGTILQFPFFAGTMFLARTRALEPLLQLQITDNDFEHEAGQVDGTLAHALERVITMCAVAGGYRLRVSRSPEGAGSVKSHYEFA